MPNGKPPSHCPGPDPPDPGLDPHVLRYLQQVLEEPRLDPAPPPPASHTHKSPPHSPSLLEGFDRGLLDQEIISIYDDEDKWNLDDRDVVGILSDHQWHNVEDPPTNSTLTLADLENTPWWTLEEQKELSDSHVSPTHQGEEGEEAALPDRSSGGEEELVHEPAAEGPSQEPLPEKRAAREPSKQRPLKRPAAEGPSEEPPPKRHAAGGGPSE